MNGQRFIQRRPLQPPDWNELSSDLRHAFLRADQLLDRARAAAAEAPCSGLSGSLPPPRLPQRHIHHPLSVKFPPITADIDLGAARAELAVLRSLPGSSPFDGQASVVKVLSQVVGRFTGNYTVRSRDVVTNEDPVGRRVRFPPPVFIPEQMAKLETVLATGETVPNSFRAIVALVLITNCHPFPDGNGRTARLIFNALASPSGGRVNFYLPLKELARYSRGGFIVRKRMAEIHNDWKPIAQFIAAGAGLWKDHLNQQCIGSNELRSLAPIDQRLRLASSGLGPPL